MNWEEIRERLFLRYLYWRGRRARIRRFLAGRKINIKSDRPSIFADRDGNIKVATMQLKARIYRDPLEFADKMNSLAARAAGEGAALLVLPELNLTQLVGLIPVVADSLEELNSMEETLSELGGEISINDLFNFIGPLTARIAQSVFSELAGNYGIYIMTGSGFIPDGDAGIYNISYLFGSDGQLLGKQKKNHLLPFEEREGIKTGNELEVIETDLAKMAFPICMDATYFETFRIAECKGAEIVMLPIADDPYQEFGDFNYWVAMRGIWGRVQESRVYGIKSSLVGRFAWFKFTGLAGVYAPAELTPDGSGILVEAGDPLEEEMFFAELDLEALKKFRSETERDSNREFWERHFPQIYYYL